MIQTTCIQCQQRFGVDESSGFTSFRCPYCSTINPLVLAQVVHDPSTTETYPQIENVSKPEALIDAEPARNHLKLILGLVVGGLGLLMLLVVGGGYWIWSAAVDRQQQTSRRMMEELEVDLNSPRVRDWQKAGNSNLEDSIDGSATQAEESFESEIDKMQRRILEEAGVRSEVLPAAKPVERSRSRSNQPNVRRSPNRKRNKPVSKKDAKWSAAVTAAKENRVKYLHAEFPDMGWGLKSLKFSPNGKLLFAGHSDRKLSVYDMERQRRVEFIDKLENLGSVSEIAVSGDGTKLLTGGDSGRIEIWKIEESGLLESLGRFVGHLSEIKSIAIDPSQRYVLSGDSDGIARLWNLSTQREMLTVRDFKDDVLGVKFLNQGATAVACDRENVVFMDVKQEEVTRRRKGFRSGSAYDIAFSPDGTQFAVTNGSGMEIFETDTASKIESLKGDAGLIWKLAFTPDGRHLLAGERVISIWNIEQSKIVYQINVGDSVNVQSIAASSDGKYLTGISPNAGTTLNVFKSPLAELEVVETPVVVLDSMPDSSNSNAVAEQPDSLSSSSAKAAAASSEESSPASPAPLVHCKFPEQGWGIDAMAFSPDGRYLYAGKNGFKVYDVERVRTIDNHDRLTEGAISQIVATPDGKHVLVGTQSGVVVIWEVDSHGQLERTGSFNGHGSKLESIAVGPNSKFVISGERKRARIWELGTQKELLSLDFSETVTSCRILPNGKTAIASDGESVTIVTLNDLKIWKKFDSVTRHGRHSALSDDGVQLAATTGGSISLVDTKTGSAGEEFKTGETNWTLLFHPDGRHLLAGGRGKVMIWDTEKVTKVAELDVPTYYVQSIAISPDGKRIAAIPGSAGQTLTVFNTPDLN